MPNHGIHLEKNIHGRMIISNKLYNFNIKGPVQSIQRMRFDHSFTFHCIVIVYQKRIIKYNTKTFQMMSQINCFDSIKTIQITITINGILITELQSMPTRPYNKTKQSVSCVCYYTKIKH